MDKKKILFLCTGNSCRSQMAEGWTNTLKADKYIAYSAGISAKVLNPKAVKAMEEVGVDITSQKSQVITEFSKENIDLVVTVCGHAHDTCPEFPRTAEVKHFPFDDPPELELNEVSEEARMGHYRRVRDEIKAFVETL